MTVTATLSLPEQGVSSQDLGWRACLGHGRPRRGRFNQLSDVDRPCPRRDGDSSSSRRSAGSTLSRVFTASSKSRGMLTGLDAFPRFTLGTPISLPAGSVATPATAAGVAEHVWSVWEIAGLLD